MRTIAVVGGKLQGLEVCYLCREAGIQVTLIDKEATAPARNICNDFLCADVMNDENRVLEAIQNADMVLPAIENKTVLGHLKLLCQQQDTVYAFDNKAYEYSSSKIRSDRLFAEIGIPAPAYYPDGAYPYIFKPSEQSGSHGVKMLKDEDSLLAALGEYRENKAIIQEYIEGPSYSIEVIGYPGHYKTYEITEIHVDEVYDCCRVTTPCNISEIQEHNMQNYAVMIAENLKLKGIMDMETIYKKGTMYVLEVDARIPSQTPITVYESTGINMVEELYELFCSDFFEGENINKKHYVNFEHYYVERGVWIQKGERIMCEGKEPLKLIKLDNGVHILSDYRDGTKPFRLTMITKADESDTLSEKRNEAIKWLKNIQ